MPTSPSPRSEQLGTPNPPAIRFTRGTSFGASRFTHLLRPAKLLAPLYGSDRYTRPSGAFTSRLPTDRLPSPLLDMTTTATGLLCWRDFHPPGLLGLVSNFAQTPTGNGRWVKDKWRSPTPSHEMSGELGHKAP